jgi:hypothetical protein
MCVFFPGNHAKNIVLLQKKIAPPHKKRSHVNKPHTNTFYFESKLFDIFRRQIIDSCLHISPDDTKFIGILRNSKIRFAYHNYSGYFFHFDLKI